MLIDEAVDSYSAAIDQFQEQFITEVEAQDEDDNNELLLFLLLANYGNII